MATNKHRSTLRVLSILKSLAGEINGFSLTELSQILNAPKSSLFPILHTLLEEKFISFNKVTSKYTMGLNTYLLGSSYVHTHEILELILKEMNLIVDQCSEICQLGILENNETLYIAKVDSPEAIRLVSDVNKKLPAHSTSLGKALLCEKSLDELTALFPDGLKKLTEHTITNLDDLYSELLETRKTSLAYDIEETNLNISCIAVPLRKFGKIVAAISVSTPNFRYTPEKKEHIEKLLLSAKISLEQILEQHEFLY